MLITDSFVMLNFPKSGSTFARAVIQEIHQRRFARLPWKTRALHWLGIQRQALPLSLMLPNVRLSGAMRERTQHGTYTQIPEQFRHREMVTIARNPYSRLLSGYEFRWWAKHPALSKQMLAAHFPNFPDLTLAEYEHLNTLVMIHRRLDGRMPQADVGPLTVQFIQMYFKSPQTVLANLTDEYLDSDRVFDDIAPVTFLRQENLSEELAIYLLEHGYSAEEAEYVRQRQRVNVTKSSRDRASLWNEHLIEELEHKERMVFRMLEAYGISYGKPKVASAPLESAIA